MRLIVATAQVHDQIVEHSLQTLRAAANIGDEFVRFGVKLALVAAGQEIRETDYHAQRFPEIVSENVEELFLLLLPALQDSDVAILHHCSDGAILEQIAHALDLGANQLGRVPGQNTRDIAERLADVHTLVIDAELTDVFLVHGPAHLEHG